MNTLKIFLDHVPFQKGNLHCHTTCSDGRVTPAECARMYREKGYTVLSITDHRTLTELSEVPEGMLLIPGTELDLTFRGYVVHILGLLADPVIFDTWSRQCSAQETVDCIRNAGGIAILAHPAWSLNTPEFMANLQGVTATEVWNSVSNVPYNLRRADSTSLLDTLASNYEKYIPFVAGDDSHFYEHEFARSATMLQMKEFTPEGFRECMQAGRFYATQGPEFTQIEFENGNCHVTCSPVDHILFASGKAWVSNRGFHGKNLTEAVYPVRPDDGFVRIELIDAAGNIAYSSQYPVRE